MRVMRVEDDPDTSNRLKRGLESNGHSVDALGNPDDALLLFGFGKYDFALLDLLVDSTTGFRIAKELKKRDPNHKLCFIPRQYVTPEIAFGDDYKKFSDACYVKKSTSLAALSAKINQIIAGS